MSLKRPQHSLDELEAPARRSKGKSRRSRRTLQSSESSSSSSSSASCSEAALPLASAPRTVEIMWGGRSAPGFTLKRKRTGAILVSTVTRATQTATTLKVGSELKLVGGFPVNRLTLQDVKKVMLMAPKPVSLVFVNADDVVLGGVDSASSPGRRSLASTTLSTANLRRSVSMDMNSLRPDSGEDSDCSDVSTVSAPAFYSTPSESNKSKKRKVSTLQVALDRVNQLLNRPVRQAGLHIAAGKSIVV
ncbi:unnamed protein product [Phytophthora fragariaefolia]|uniref:Unnamed protein product n=1 Tax=Phytophthora fragariaefolia TaxID=1490495 RepID=A0A9W6Y3N3_9STRA|nr:unnamed protein product [Phytophthora fragariaefolia]